MVGWAAASRPPYSIETGFPQSVWAGDFLYRRNSRKSPRHCEERSDVAIPRKGPQHGTPYQEIATACGLAMTCLWEHGADSPDRVDPSRRGDPCGRPGPHHEWWDGRPQADRPTDPFAKRFLSGNPLPKRELGWCRNGHPGRGVPTEAFGDNTNFLHIKAAHRSVRRCEIQTA